MASSTCGTLIVCTILLLTDACLAQQRRSKSSSSQSISQVVDFDCPEEFGYYPHPADCTQYYVCVFGGALLESCTGGLMYSHELQTCDWPRNVGCGGGESSIESATVSTVQVTDPRTRQTTPIQPFSRSTPSQRQQQQLQREEIPKQQHQLYAEEDLGPAEEIESDRQQRVYRGQPATLGQVARDRDGLSRHSNALQVSPGVGREKLSVVSFGTQQQYSSDKKTKPPDIDKLLDKKDYTHPKELLRPKRQTQFLSYPGSTENFQGSQNPWITNSAPFLPPHPGQRPFHARSPQRAPPPQMTSEFNPGNYRTHSQQPNPFRNSFVRVTNQNSNQRFHPDSNHQRFHPTMSAPNLKSHAGFANSPRHFAAHSTLLTSSEIKDPRVNSFEENGQLMLHHHSTSTTERSPIFFTINDVVTPPIPLTSELSAVFNASLSPINVMDRGAQNTALSTNFLSEIFRMTKNISNNATRNNVSRLNTPNFFVPSTTATTLSPSYGLHSNLSTGLKNGVDVLLSQDSKIEEFVVPYEGEEDKQDSVSNNSKSKKRRRKLKRKNPSNYKDRRINEEESSPENYDSSIDKDEEENYKDSRSQDQSENSSDEQEKSESGKEESTDEEEEEEDDKSGKKSDEEEEKDESDSFDKMPFPTPPADFYLDPEEKYKGIRNPFANPGFDFDRFLEKLSEIPRSQSKPSESETKPSESETNPQQVKLQSQTPTVSAAPVNVDNKPNMTRVAGIQPTRARKPRRRILRRRNNRINPSSENLPFEAIPESRKASTSSQESQPHRQKQRGTKRHKMRAEPDNKENDNSYYFNDDHVIPGLTPLNSSAIGHKSKENDNLYYFNDDQVIPEPFPLNSSSISQKYAYNRPDRKSEKISREITSPNRRRMNGVSKRNQVPSDQIHDSSVNLKKPRKKETEELLSDKEEFIPDFDIDIPSFSRMPLFTNKSSKPLKTSSQNHKNYNSNSPYTFKVGSELEDMESEDFGFADKKKASQESKDNHSDRDRKRERFKTTFEFDDEDGRKETVTLAPNHKYDLPDIQESYKVTGTSISKPNNNVAASEKQKALATNNPEKNKFEDEYENAYGDYNDYDDYNFDYAEDYSLESLNKPILKSPKKPKMPKRVAEIDNETYNIPESPSTDVDEDLSEGNEEDRDQSESDENEEDSDYENTSSADTEESANKNIKQDGDYDYDDYDDSSNSNEESQREGGQDMRKDQTRDVSEGEVEEHRKPDVIDHHAHKDYETNDDYEENYEEGQREEVEDEDESADMRKGIYNNPVYPVKPLQNDGQYEVTENIAESKLRKWKTTTPFPPTTENIQSTTQRRPYSVTNQSRNHPKRKYISNLRSHIGNSSLNKYYPTNSQTPINISNSNSNVFGKPTRSSIDVQPPQIPRTPHLHNSQGIKYYFQPHNKTNLYNVDGPSNEKLPVVRLRPIGLRKSPTHVDQKLAHTNLNISTRYPTTAEPVETYKFMKKTKQKYRPDHLNSTRSTDSNSRELMSSNFPSSPKYRSPYPSSEASDYNDDRQPDRFSSQISKHNAMTKEPVTDRYFTSETQAIPIFYTTSPATKQTIDLTNRGSASPATYIEQATTPRVSSSRSYNNTQYNPQTFDSFYNLYDDEADLYKDIEYSQYSGQNNNQQQQPQQQQQYRSQVYNKEKQQQQPAAAVVTQQVQLEQPQQQQQPQQRYTQPSYSAQDIYAQSVNAQDYNDNYNLQNDDIQYKSQLQGKSSASRLEETSTTAVPGTQRQSTNQPAPVALRLTDERSPPAAPPSPTPSPPSTSAEPASTPRRLSLSAAFTIDNSGASARRVAPQLRSRGSVKAISVEDPQSINDGLISAFINDYIDVDSSFEQRRRFNTDNARNSPSSYTKPEEQQVLPSQTSTEQPPIVIGSRSNSDELSNYNSQGSLRSSQVESRSSRPTFLPSRSETTRASITEPQQRSRNELNSFRIVVEPTASSPEEEEEDVTVNDKSIWRQVKVTNIRSRVMPNRQQAESQKTEPISIQAASVAPKTPSEDLRTVPIRPRIRVSAKPIEEEVRPVHFVRSTTPPQPAPIELTTPSSPPPPPPTTTQIPSTTTQSRRIIGYRAEEPSFYARLPEENAVNYHDDRRESHLLSKGAGQEGFSQNSGIGRDEFEESFSFEKKLNSPISGEAPRQDNSQFVSYSKPSTKSYEESDDSIEETNDEKPRLQVSRGRTSSRIIPSTPSTRLSLSTSTPVPLTNVTEAPRFTRPVLRGRAPSPSSSPSTTHPPSRCPDSQSECNEKPLVRQRPAQPTESPTSASSNPGLSRGSGRTRGSATYTISPNEAEAPNRGTPASVGRARPTLKPATTIVSKASEYIDIFKYPPSRPGPIYPTPQPDKTAAKCRKDVCLLPDCYCGGKDIPGELLPEETPQIVLLTFDDSINDLNKQLYIDLFEKGRTNPNGCPIAATFYVSHEWTDYSMVQNLYATGHEMASHSVSHSFGEQFSERKWLREIGGQREILAAYGGVRLEDIRGMRAPFLSVGGNKMFKMLHDGNFTYDSSMPIYENKPPSWPYTLDYKLFHDCMIPPCPTRSYPGVWEVPMVMWQDLNGGRCSMGDACSNPPNADGVYKMLIKNFERHFTSNRAPFGLFYHSAWFTQPHHKEGFIAFLDTITAMPEVWLVTNWQALQWVRDPTPINRLNNFAPFQCNYPERPRRCNNAKVCNLWHKSGVRYLKTCQPCPEIYPWTGKTGIRNSRVDNDIAQE